MRIIREKGFLRQIYEEWYRLLIGHLPDGGGAVLEIGSGGGFLKEYHKDATCFGGIFHTSCRYCF